MTWPRPGNLPENWAECDGRSLKPQDYAPLFALIGTTYGGDGVTSFCLPDLRGRVAVGAGIPTFGGNYVLAQAGGAATQTVQQANIPPHTHGLTPATAATGTYKVTSDANASSTCTGRRLGTGTGGIMMYKAQAPNVPIATASGPYMVEIGTSGTPQSVATRPPYLGLRFIICLNGLFPERTN